MIDRDQPVRVFLNPKHGCYNIMQAGRIRALAREVRLRDVTFLVRESGRLRMLRRQRRVVHAYAVGMLVDFAHPDEPARLQALHGPAVTYNPYRFETFVDRDTHAPVLRSPLVQLDERGVFRTPDGELAEAA